MVNTSNLESFQAFVNMDRFERVQPSGSVKLIGVKRSEDPLRLGSHRTLAVSEALK